IWATEVPNLGQPQFTITAPSLVAFEGGRIAKPVQFYAYSNYPAFIDHAEVLVYRASDVDLVAPLASIALPVAAVSEVKWDGALGETWPRRMQLVRPDEVERGAQVVRNAVETSHGSAFSTEQAQSQSLVDQAFGENSLRQQNIGIYGSRIRIQGRNLPENYS